MPIKFTLQSVAAVLVSLATMTLHAETASIDGPFAYPTGLLDAPATLSNPAGDAARIGVPKVVLEETTLEELAVITGATRLREGRGDFKRDTLCLTGTENGKPLIAWFIATDSDKVTEAQIEWIGDRDAPEYCSRLQPNRLPVRLGKIGLSMTEKEILDYLGEASFTDNAGWHYWFSQRFLRNDRDLQELELNWLAVRFDKNGRVSQAFISQVTNL